MGDTPDLAVIVGVFVVLIGIGVGLLVDRLRPATGFIAGCSVALIGFLVAGLAPDAVLSAPLLVTAYGLTTYVRDRAWRASLVRRREEPRTSPSPAPSATVEE